MNALDLLKKYGVSANPLPFDDDIVSVTQVAANKTLQKMVIAPTPKAPPVVTKVSVPSKFTAIKLKRKYTKRTIATTEETLETIPQYLRDLFKKSPEPVYINFLAAQFPSSMEAASFAQGFSNSNVLLDGFAHMVHVREDEHDRSVFFNKAKSMSAITYYTHRKVV